MFCKVSIRPIEGPRHPPTTTRVILAPPRTRSRLRWVPQVSLLRPGKAAGCSILAAPLLSAARVGKHDPIRAQT
jgi:hypothetical protein